MLEKPFQLKADYTPAGDQPQAIEMLVAGLERGDEAQTLLGVTGSGKTFTMANVVQQVQRPTLVIAHNKTLAAQLYNELKEFFPENAVEYFISYYDYYQPEAYIPRTDTYIEKTASINDEIDRLRHSATKSLYERRDTIVVASVSCIYGLGTPESYFEAAISLEQGMTMEREDFLARLVQNQYTRVHTDMRRSTFRVRGDVVDVQPADEERVLRIEFFGDTLERIAIIQPETGEVVEFADHYTLFPAIHHIADPQKLEEVCLNIERELDQRLSELYREGKEVEAKRLEGRTWRDLEIIREIGHCNGIENYSRILEGRPPGSPPRVLLDYFPKDFLLIIDESHVTLPQLRGMYHGDVSRKNTLVEYGFRLPAARDNRPLNFDEFLARIGQRVFVSATPAEYELSISTQVAEQIIRPTGLVDPEVTVVPTQNQVDRLLTEIQARVAKNERVLVTTLTKRMAEDLTEYLQGLNVRVRYLHSEIKSLERVEIIRDLRLGTFDVLIGVNLLREGLDLPEVSLVAIMDADKEGFLRSEQSLIQTIGRAARNVQGEVLLFADKTTESMRRALDETNRRRAKQVAYNQAHGIIPKTIEKKISNGLLDLLGNSPDLVASRKAARQFEEEVQAIPPDQLPILIEQLEAEMRQAAQLLEFEKAARLRDQLHALKACVSR